VEVLLQGGARWQEYAPRYLEPLRTHGVSSCRVTVPDGDGHLDLGALESRLRGATGILIGGGNTRAYLGLYAAEPVRGLIRAAHDRGVPVAGVSAGALITLDDCVVLREPARDAPVTIEKGLGLLHGFIVAPHFTEWDMLPSVFEAMALTRTQRAFGLDESAAAVFEDGAFQRALGAAVYGVSLRHVDARSYKMTELQAN